MNKTIRLTMVLCLAIQANLAVAQIGIMPVPQVDAAEVEATVEIVKAAGGEPTQYIYRYTITNPAASTDGFYKFSLDISAEVTDFAFPSPDLFFPTLQTLPKEGGASTRPFVEEVDLLAPFIEGYEGQGVVPIGLVCPPGWTGGLRRNATVVCYAANGTPTIAPGESLSGFAIHSRFPPMLREVDSSAFWTVVVNDLDDEVDTIDRAAAFQVLKDLRRPQVTIGPGFHFPTDRAHYVLLARDLADMKALGWIPNATLAEEITTIIDDAGTLYRSGQGIEAKLRLDDVVAALNSAADSDILPNAATFLLVNVDSIQEFGRNTFPSGGLDTNVRFSPGAASLRVGETYEVEAFAFRLNSVDFRSGIVEEPSLGTTVYFGCNDSAPVDPGVDPCPNVPLADNSSPNNRTPVPVDANGIARFSYVGVKPGRDHIDVCIDRSCEGVLGNAIVDWADPPDLVVEAFSPPIIFAESGEFITFTDRTANYGTGSSAESFTAYFISPTVTFDIDTVGFVDGRVVPSLSPGEVSEEVVEDLELPPGFDMGEHYLFACADAGEEVDESDEFNNCSDAALKGSAFFAVPVADFPDLFAVTINDASTDEGDVGTTGLLLDVNLNKRNPNTAISFDYETVDGAATVVDNDYIATSGTITFSSGSGSANAQQIPISIVGDTRVEDDETFTLLITPVLGGAAYRSTFIAVTINNDDVSNNTAPIGHDQAVVTDVDIPVGLILTGDDDDGDELTFSVVAGPENGSLTGTAPNLTYTPDFGFFGADSFTFTANDGTVDSNIATVSIFVNAKNSAPIANDQSISTDEDVSVGITLSAQDSDGDTLSFAVQLEPMNGSLSGVAPDIIYTPDSGFSGTDGFTFTANDGTVDSNIATVSIAVNPTGGTGSCTSTLGIADRYNGLVFGHYTSTSSDVQGRLAVEGDLSLNWYSLADGLSAETAGTSVVVGGNMDFLSGQIFFGDVVVGGVATVGANILNGSLTDHTTVPVDFGAAKQDMEALSQSLSQLPANGTFEFQWGGFQLYGDGSSDLQVFSLNGSDVLSAHTFNVQSIPADATIVFNVSGANTGMTNMSLQSLESHRERVVFNFYQATQLTLNGIGVEGSILAPNAAVDNPQGQVRGTVIAKSWNGPMELHHNPFAGCLE